MTYDEVTAVNSRVLRSEFQILDVNRDRRLSAVEVQAPGAEAILNRGVSSSGTVLSVSDISGGQFVSQSELAAAYPGLKPYEFDLIDTNNDGRVSSTEIYASAAQDILSEHEHNGSILVSMDRVDTDGSGFASLAELQAVYPGTTANDLRDFDVNRDGRISFNEFYAPLAIEILGENQ
ncbi:MAG: EF-hand domain-containing protein [Paracoccaceae bacterium]|nr:EF-hand domain-containing protein [Paracoccaceae bacterium]